MRCSSRLKNMIQCHTTQRNFSSVYPELPKSCNVKRPDDFTTLSNGQKIPIVGLGTWGGAPGQTKQAVMYAIDVGYRHIDCAHVYENEHEVGEAIAEKIKEGKITRKDLFITSKLWNTFHRPDLVRDACNVSLRALRLNYVDLYLMHWPMAYREGNELFPVDACGKILYSRVDYIDTWKAMETLVKERMCKSIGVSNFSEEQLVRILSSSKTKPVVNQVECHPYLPQWKLKKYCKKQNIAIIAYSPLGSPARPWARPDEPVLLNDPLLDHLAYTYKVTPGQILIRYQMQRGNIVIPKSVTKERISSNFDVFDFKIQSAHMRDLCKLGKHNLRYVHLKGVASHPYYPFKELKFK